MKKSLILPVLFLLSIGLNAQEEALASALKIKKIDFMVSLESDKIKNFDASYFTNQMSDDIKFPFAEVNFEDVDLVTHYALPNYRLGLTFELPKNNRIELSSTINWAPRKYNLMTFHEGNISEHIDEFGNLDDFSFASISMGQIQSDIGLEASLLYTLVDNRIIKVYGGGGSNASISYNERMYIIGSNINDIDGVILRDEELFVSNLGNQTVYECNDLATDLKSQFNHRFFAQAGASIILFEDFEIGFNVRKGIGYRTVKDETTHLTNFLSGNLSLSYIL